MDAVHEAIVNAFAHRDIENGQSVEIIFLKNRIEVTSPGHFPDGKTPDMFIHGNEPPIRRNRLITRTLYYSKDMESFATGLKRIQDSCDKAGVILFLELGVGYNTPVIIKYPFWKMTAQNPKAVYACLNFGEAYVPDEIAEKSICINGDIREVLNSIAEK